MALTICLISLMCAVWHVWGKYRNERERKLGWVRIMLQTCCWCRLKTRITSVVSLTWGNLTVLPCFQSSPRLNVFYTILYLQSQSSFFVSLLLYFGFSSPPLLVETQYLHFGLHADYFLLPPKISRRIN